MSRALVMAVYYTAPLPIRIRVDFGCTYTNKYTFQRLFMFVLYCVVIYY